MRAAVESVPADPAELHEAEEVCARCRLVVWTPAKGAECSRSECPA